MSYLSFLLFAFNKNCHDSVLHILFFNIFLKIFIADGKKSKTCRSYSIFHCWNPISTLYYKFQCTFLTYIHDKVSQTIENIFP